MKTRIRSATILLFAVILSLLLVGQSAQAGYTVTLKQVGADVVANGSGALDLSGLPFIGTGFGGQTIGPDNALILIGADGFFDDYDGFPVLSGPTSFGFGATPASSGAGDHVGIDGITQELFVPQNYVSGNPLSSSAIWSLQTLDSLHVIPGTYEWTWGTGVNQNFTLQIGAAGVADPGSTLGLLFLSLVVLFGASRLRSVRLALRLAVL